MDRSYQKITRLRSYLQPSAVDIKSLKSCKLTLSLINVVSVRITSAVKNCSVLLFN